MLQMKEFMLQFLSGSYTALMGEVRKMLQPGLGVSRLSRTDFIAFSELAATCTAFVRLREASLADM